MDKKADDIFEDRFLLLSYWYHAFLEIVCERPEPFTLPPC
jgi:hypothetical protein